MELAEAADAAPAMPCEQLLLGARVSLPFLATGFCSPSSTFRSSELYGKIALRSLARGAQVNVHAAVVRHAESNDIVLHALAIFRREIGVLLRSALPPLCR